MLNIVGPNEEGGSGFWVQGSGFGVKRFWVQRFRVLGSRKDFNPSALNRER
jgi:hypothetical protein